MNERHCNTFASAELFEEIYNESCADWICGVSNTIKSETKLWEHIPFQDREDVYCSSIKLHHHLWVKPTYGPGEVWSFYGGFQTKHTIIEVFKDSNQVLTQTLDGNRHIFKMDKWGYASNGTPSLRIREL